MDDVLSQIEEWREKGERTVVMGYFNRNVRANKIRELRENLGLREVLLDSVGEENVPSTYNNGSRPIDIITCSANITTVKAGYLPFREGGGYHITLLIDIEEGFIFGTAEAPSTKLRAHRFKFNNPRIILTYLQLLNGFYTKKMFKKCIR